jgi:hypothetical protein
MERDDGEVPEVVYADVARPKKKVAKRGFSRETLYKDLIGKGEREEIARLAVDEYAVITGCHNYQDSRRYGLLFACVLKVYRDKGILYDLRQVASRMKLNTATTSRGLRLYYDHSKALGRAVPRLELEPVDYARMLVHQLVTTEERWCTSGLHDRLDRMPDGSVDTEHIMRCISSILAYLNRLDVHSITKSSTPRCVASGVVYFHLVARGCVINKAVYSSLSGCAIVSSDKSSDDVAASLKKLRENIKNAEL